MFYKNFRLVVYVFNNIIATFLYKFAVIISIDRIFYYIAEM